MAEKGQELSQLRESRTIFENKYAQRSKERWGFKWVWETDSTRQTRSFVQRISQKCYQVGKSMIIIRTNQNSIQRQSLQKLSQTNTTFMETSWSRVEKGAVTVIRPPPPPTPKNMAAAREKCRFRLELK